MATIAPKKGSLPVLQYCTPAQLAVDPSYQRELDASSHKLIAAIAAGWDWNLFQPLVVAQRLDRSLWVVDGQHRLEAARLRGDVEQLPCVIFMPGDPADEAEVFVQLNTKRRPLSAYALFNAGLAAGDEQALALDTLMREAGLRFGGSADPDQLKPGQVNIVGRLRNWHKRYGDTHTRAALTALSRVVRTQGPRNAGLMLVAIGATVVERGDTLIGQLFGEILDRPAEEWLSAFHARAAADQSGLQAAAIAVIADAYAEALREIEDDDTPAPTAAPEPPRGPADPRRSTSGRRARQWKIAWPAGRRIAEGKRHG